LSVLWALALVIPRGLGDCPFLAKLIGVACLAGAYLTAFKFSGPLIERITIIGFILVFGLQLVTRGEKALKLRNGSKMSSSSAQILIMLIAKLCVYYGIMNSSYRGMLADRQSLIIQVYLGSLLAMGALLPDPLIFVVVFGSVVGHIISALVDNSTLFLFCSAFTATLFQGLSHALSGEEGTLVVLQGGSLIITVPTIYVMCPAAEKSADAKLAYEWSHVVFFPNILLHACFRRLKLVKEE
jgi:hypothetical protein